MIYRSRVFHCTPLYVSEAIVFLVTRVSVKLETVIEIVIGIGNWNGFQWSPNRECAIALQEKKNSDSSHDQEAD